MMDTFDFDTDLNLFEQWVGLYLRPASVKNRLYYARRFNTWCTTPPSGPRGAVITCPWTSTAVQIGEFLRSCGQSPSTRKNAADALRLLFKWGLQARRITTNPMVNLPKITVPRALPHPTPRDVVSTALTTCSRRTDALMILVALLAGLRCGEIATLHSDNVRDGYLHIAGKGGHERDIPLHTDLADILTLLPRGWFFPSDRNPTGHMLPASIGQRLGDLLGPGWSGHSLRHWFATCALEACGDVLVVQNLLGHKNLNTTMVYTLVSGTRLQEAVLGITPPVQPERVGALRAHR